MNNKTKTILFTSLIAAMILPFSAMDLAEASPSLSYKEKISLIEKEIEQIKSDKSSSEKTQKNIQDSLKQKAKTLSDLYIQLENAQNNQQQSDVDEIKTQIEVVISEISSLNPRISELDDTIKQEKGNLVGKWNEKAKNQNLDYSQTYDGLVSNDDDFKEASESVLDILSQESQSDTEWDELFDNLELMLVKFGENQTLTYDEKEHLKEIISADIVKSENVQQVSQYLQSNFPPIYFMSASSTSCGTPTDYLPFHYQLDSDISAGNGLEKTYAKMFDGTIHDKSLSNKCIIEVTHVYYDEDDPSSALEDAAYDLVRSGWYGRGNTDLETYFLVVDKDDSAQLDHIAFQKITATDGGLLGVSDYEFGGAYSGTNTISSTSHLVANVTSFSLEEDQHPKIYVNTWNHSFGEADNNSDSSSTKTEISSYTTGDRMKAENDYTSYNDYDDETLGGTP